MNANEFLDKMVTIIPGQGLQSKKLEDGVPIAYEKEMGIRHLD